MNKLVIDTRDSKKVVACLEIGAKKFESVSTSQTRHPESIVNLIENVLKKAGIKASDIDEIKVEEGPGSYTGLKVGASVANALSFALNKKINGNEIGKIIEPKYE
jgi:tRNA threonylcarbamoyladenosine biosynthesis protein TsaB